VIGRRAQGRERLVCGSLDGLAGAGSVTPRRALGPRGEGCLGWASAAALPDGPRLSRVDSSVKNGLYAARLRIPAPDSSCARVSNVLPFQTRGTHVPLPQSKRRRFLCFKAPLHEPWP